MAGLGDDLLVTVNKLQDLVFNTIGNDSLDLPQIVSHLIQREAIDSYLLESLAYLVLLLHRLSLVPNRRGNPQCSKISLVATFFLEVVAL
jgi:hypothetical protein